MNDLIEYFSDKQELLFSYVVLLAAFVIVVAAGLLVKAAIRRSRARKTELSDRAIESVDCEGYALKIIEENGGYYAALFSGDKTLAISKAYTSVAGVKSALKSLKSNILSDNFTVYFSDGNFFVRLFSSVKLIYESEAFSTREDAEKAIALIKKAAANAAE